MPQHAPVAYGSPVATAPAAPRTGWSPLAITAFALAAFETGALLLVRLIAVTTAYNSAEGTQALATVFGVLGLLSIVLTVGVIVLGHLALRQTKNDVRRGRVLAGAALGVGYFHLLLWGNRVILAAIAAATLGDFTQFLPNVFYWA